MHQPRNANALGREPEDASTDARSRARASSFRSAHLLTGLHDRLRVTPDSARAGSRLADVVLHDDRGQLFGVAGGGRGGDQPDQPR
jgi:hypothetical protein